MMKTIFVKYTTAASLEALMGANIGGCPGWSATTVIETLDGWFVAFG